jgi:malonate transporter and related proteins
MLDVVNVTGVVFVLIALGFFAVKISLFSERDLGVLIKYAVNFALPALLLRAFALRDFSEIVDGGYLVAYAAGSLISFIFFYMASRYLLKRSAGQATFRAVGTSSSNSGFVGYPIVLVLLPEVADRALALNMMVENILILPLTLLLAERATNSEIGGLPLARKIAGKLLGNPMIVAIFVGLAISIAGIPLPRLISGPIDLLASSSAAVSLVVIGGTLAGLSLNTFNFDVIMVTAGKLIVHPLAVFAMVALFAGLGFGIANGELATAAIIYAALPPMSIYPILAARYGFQNVAAPALFLSTCASFFTLSILIWFLMGGV